jgi:hypothetical protein
MKVSLPARTPWRHAEILSQLLLPDSACPNYASIQFRSEFYLKSHGIVTGELVTGVYSKEVHLLVWPIRISRMPLMCSCEA